MYEMFFRILSPEARPRLRPLDGASGWPGLLLTGSAQWKEAAFPMVPPSFSESPLSPQHFIAVFNSSQVAPSGTDGGATHGSASRMLRPRCWHAVLESGRHALLCLRDTLSAHWPGIRDLPLIRTVLLPSLN